MFIITKTPHTHTVYYIFFTMFCTKKVQSTTMLVRIHVLLAEN